MKKPATLRQGDKIAIITTARKVTKRELTHAISLIQEWGLEVVIGKSIEAEYYQFGGEDKVRRKDLQEQLDDPEIKAIWCARGGYGTVRILDDIDFSNFVKNPKWVVGYSDLTVLHSEIHNRNIQSLHAQMPVSLENKSSKSAESIRKLLFGEEYNISFKSNHKLNKEGKTKGILTGGNLSMLYSVCGSTSALTTKDKILFIEDLDEYLYHIDRMMQNLKRNGYFENIKALLVGGMSDMKDNSIPFGYTAEEIISQYVSHKDIPVVFNFPSGHLYNNLALNFGKEVQLSLYDNQCKLT